MHIAVLAHNIRSTHNIGSIFRTCEGFGVHKLLLSGYTPVPNDNNQPPHIRKKLTEQIHKTALGAEELVPSFYVQDPLAIIATYKQQGFTIVALEQALNSTPLPHYHPDNQAKILLVLGEEVHGIEPHILQLCDTTLEIPMVGQKESFNVSVAAGIALYQLRFSI